MGPHQYIKGVYVDIGSIYKFKAFQTAEGRN
jgi:hypothetical protein